MRRATVAAVGTLLLAMAGSARAVELHWREGTVRGFPAMLDPRTGRVVAEGTHVQSVTGNQLRVTTTFAFPDGRRIQEESEFRQGRELAQEKWRWEERVGGEIIREFQMDFSTGQAHALKVEEGKRKEWSGKVDVKPGLTFAGSGFVFALKNLSERLETGETVELTAIAFTPAPRAVPVKVFSQGRESVRVAGRSMTANHFILRPQIPWIAKAFVQAPDNHMWFYRSPPPAFLRAEAPLMEPNDPVGWIDVQDPVGRAAAARRAGPSP